MKCRLLGGTESTAQGHVRKVTGGVRMRATEAASAACRLDGYVGA